MAKTKKKDHVIEERRVEVLVKRTDGLFLRQSLGEADMGSYKIKIDAVLSGGILIAVDKEKYLFSADELIFAAVDAHEKRDKSKNGRLA